MRKVTPVLMLLATLPLAGCWQGKTSLYGEARPLQPLGTGKVIGVNADKKETEHLVLTKEAGGVYRLTNDEKDSSDFGDSFAARLFSFRGAPSGVLIFEAQERKNCKPGDNSCTQDPMYYYGLAKVKSGSAEVVNPNCDKDSATAKIPGVVVGDYGTCTFPDRATLEKAMLAFAQEPWKPQVTYTLQ
jgi:hypothetical protein